MMKVGVALSGGKDSSLTAALLLKNGHRVVGFHLRLCPDEYALLPESRQLEAVKELSRLLQIELRIVDLKKKFRREIMGAFTESYRKGLTPNPCVRCNRIFKFGFLREIVLKEGCDKLASGHYARVEKKERYFLKKSADPKRDESYFLFELTPEQLSSVLFPLGQRTEAENQELFRKLLPAFTPLAPTQEACFLARKGLRAFLAENLSEARAFGEIVNRQGEKLGRHSGYQYYTIGQRKGLSSASGKKGPLFVLRTIPEKNQVVVGPKKDLLSSRLLASDSNWVSIFPPAGRLKVSAKIRYSHRGAKAIVAPTGDNQLEVLFFRPQEAITPGQAVVFYQDDILLGGAWIDRSF